MVTSSQASLLLLTGHHVTSRLTQLWTSHLQIEVNTTHDTAAQGTAECLTTNRTSRVTCQLANNAPSCQGKYTYQFEENCYAFIPDAKPYAAAQVFCQSLGGFLAEIVTPEQNGFMEQILFEQHPDVMWLGATDVITENQWFWSHSDTPMSRYFTDWNPGEPTNSQGQEDCLTFNYKYKHWNDVPCDYKYPFVCQKPIYPPEVGK